MKIIEELGMLHPKQSSTKKYRYVIAECEHCGCDVRMQARTLKKRKYCLSCSRSINSSGHKLSSSPIYRHWIGMKSRCNSNEHYIKKGIAVCSEWINSPEVFIAWANENGYNKNLSLDRIKSDKDYEPSNCRWATKQTQAQNQCAIQINNTSGFRGVSSNSEHDGYNAYVQNNGKTKNLGRYNTAKDAAIVYDNWHRENNNIDNTLNFPFDIFDQPDKAIHERFSNPSEYWTDAKHLKSHFETKPGE